MDHNWQHVKSQNVPPQPKTLINLFKKCVFKDKSTVSIHIAKPLPFSLGRVPQSDVSKTFVDKLTFKKKNPKRVT